MSAAVLGSFYTEKTLYEYQNVYDRSTGKRALQQVNGEDALYIEPTEEYFGGTVICLINQKCVSSGEGIAMMRLESRFVLWEVRMVWNPDICSRSSTSVSASS